jgi:hypothetical protein
MFDLESEISFLLCCGLVMFSRIRRIARKATMKAMTKPIFAPTQNQKNRTRMPLNSTLENQQNILLAVCHQNLAPQLPWSPVPPLQPPQRCLVSHQPFVAK